MYPHKEIDDLYYDELVPLIQSIALTLIIICGVFYICSTSNRAGFSFFAKIMLPCLFIMLGENAFPILLNLFILIMVYFFVTNSDKINGLLDAIVPDVSSVIVD